MTREQAQDFLAAVQAAFPNFNPKDKKAAVNMWHVMLTDYPYDKVFFALKEYISSENTGFPPSIGQIVNIIKSQEKKNRFDKLEKTLLENYCGDRIEQKRQYMKGRIGGDQE